MSPRLAVTEPGRLRAFLRLALPGWKRATLEQRLATGCVRVNGRTVTRPDAPLDPGDEVAVLDPGESEAAGPARVAGGIEILFADEHLVAIDKPAGLLSVSSAREREHTALALVRTALRGARSELPLWPVHRLDRETSGLLLLARTQAARRTLQARWTEVTKLYLAVVEGVPEPPGGTIDQPLLEDENLFVRVGERPGARAARTRYATLRAAGGRALLEVQLDTGHKHQIRAHLAWLGHPVVGDERYGRSDRNASRPAARLGLHAFRLELPHPAEDRRLSLEAPPPRAFEALLPRARSG